MEGEDTVVVVLNFENGTIGNLIVTWGAKNPLTQPLFVVYGTEGTIWEDSGNLYLIKAQEQQIYKAQIPGQEGNSIEAAIFHFVDCILNDKSPLVTFDIARRDLELVLAIYRSIAQNNAIALSFEGDEKDVK